MLSLSPVASTRARIGRARAGCACIRTEGEMLEAGGLGIGEHRRTLDPTVGACYSVEVARFQPEYPCHILEKASGRREGTPALVFDHLKGALGRACRRPASVRHGGLSGREQGGVRYQGQLVSAGRTDQVRPSMYRIHPVCRHAHRVRSD
jgi:hypothetical protein